MARQKVLIFCFVLTASPVPLIVDDFKQSKHTSFVHLLFVVEEYFFGDPSAPQMLL